MALDNELAFVRYILEACGEITAVEAIKRADPRHFTSQAIREAVKVSKNCIDQGIWPQPKDIYEVLDKPTTKILEDAIKNTHVIIDIDKQLTVINNEYNHNYQLKVISEGYHGLKGGNVTVEQLIRRLESTLVEKSTWSERNFKDVMSDIRKGAPLDVSLSKPNLFISGITSFDHVLVAPGGSYSFVAGLPGTGKTSLMFQVASLSAMAGNKVKALSLETPRSTLEAKAAATWFKAKKSSAYVGEILRKGGVRNIPTYDEAEENLDIAFHPSGLKWEELEAIIRRDTKDGVRLFLVDYFGLLQPPDLGGRDNRYMLAEQMSKGAKGLCGELDIHISFVAQPNRENKYGERPDPTELGVTSQLQRDVDFGILLWVDETANEKFKQANGEQFKLMKGWLHKNRLFNRDEACKTDPEVWIKSEFRCNWFEEIDEPMDVKSGWEDDRL